MRGKRIRNTRRARRRRRLIRCLTAWAVCIGLVIAVAVGTARLVTALTSSERRELRAQGMEALESGNYAEALTFFEQALDSANGKDRAFERDVLLYRAETEFKLKDYEAALHTCELLTERGEDSLTLSYWRAICYGRLGEADRAVSVYEETVAREKADDWSAGRLQALIAAGSACVRGGDYEKAMSLYQPALEKGIEGGQIYNQVGLCQMAQESYQDALDSFNRGLAALGEKYGAGSGASPAQILTAMEADPEQRAGEDDRAALRELAFNRAAASEYTQQYAQALTLYEEYVDTFGADDSAQHEIEFLKTR